MLISKRKRYLSGSDWVINTLDHQMKSATCSGNMSQLVLLVNETFDEQQLRDRLRNAVRSLPVLHGSVARDYKLTPYWKIPKIVVHDLVFRSSTITEVSPGSALLPLLEKNANSAFNGDNDHLAFHSYTDGRRSALAMTFDHRLFDARGAELFLDFLSRRRETASETNDVAFSSSQELTQWMKKFVAGRNVNRKIMALSRSTPKSFPLPGGHNRGFRYSMLSFNEVETVKVYDRATREAGYLMEAAFFLSAITQAVHDLLKNRPGPGTSYLIPVTMDLRSGREPFQEMFFNHVSYIFYQIPVGAVGELKPLIGMLKQQMYDQVKAGFPKDLAEASLLTRIAPLPLLGKLLHLPMKGNMATFAFSHLGKSSYVSNEFMGRKIADLFHMPRVPVPPGLGFFSNLFNGRLTLVISHLDGLMQDDELKMLEAGIRTRFLQGTA